jgi:hypothetical protein
MIASTPSQAKLVSSQPLPPAPPRRPMFGRHQLAFIAFVTVIVVAWNASFFVLSRADAEGPLFDYQGTSGPFAIVLDGQDYVAGAPISTVKRGGLLGWTTTLCIHKGAEGLGVTELVKLSPNEEEIVNRVETPIAGDGLRCGARTIARLVPVDAPIGYYEVRRQLLLSVNGRPKPPVSLQSLHIRVEP